MGEILSTFSFLKSRTLASVAVVGIVAAGLSGAVISSAHADDDSGSTLVKETFKGASVADSRWMAFGDACLTAATESAPSGQSKLGPCAKTQDTAYLTGKSNGFLQLTDNSAGRTSNVLFNRAIPSRAGLDINFYQYQFANGSDTGLGAADGIGFFLADGSNDLTKTGPMGGGFGGALGYGTIEGEDGLAHGVLGIGLDAYGNYANQPYVGRKCADKNSFTSSSVSLRGAGDGKDGYCLQKNTSGQYATKSNLINTGVPAAGVDGANNGTLVNVKISPTSDANPLPTVTVSLNGTVVSTYQLSDPLPPTIKFGFASSTGRGHEAHLVRLDKVKTIEPLGAISLVKTVDHSDSTGTTKTVFTTGDDIPYSFLVTNTGEEVINDIAVTDEKIPAGITCPKTSLDPADSMVCTGTYSKVTAAEAGAGEVDNTADVNGVTDGGDSVTDQSKATAPTYTKGKF